MKKLFKFALLCSTIGYFSNLIERMVIIFSYIRENTTLEEIGRKAYENGICKEGIRLRSDAYDWFYNS